MTETIIIILIVGLALAYAGRGFFRGFARMVGLRDRRGRIAAASCGCSGDSACGGCPVAGGTRTAGGSGIKLHRGGND